MSSPSAEIAAANIIALRTKRGWSQQELADRCEISRPRIAEIESGRFNPTVDTIDRIARELGVSTARIFRRPQASQAAS